MLNKPFNWVERNIEICCSKMIKNPCKNFQLSFTGVHFKCTNIQ